MYRIPVLIILMFTFISGFSQSDIEKTLEIKEKNLQQLKDSQELVIKSLEGLKLKWIQEQIKQKGLPEINRDGFLIAHSAMTLFYSPEHEQAWWVVHMVLPDIKYGTQGRTNDFRTDSLLKVGTADKNDYLMSGYDRGHLAPSADFRWSKKALSESYYYSNMSPQRPELNRGKWADLENFVRQYVLTSNEPVFVVTGGVLKDSLKYIGIDKKISVPKFYYKIIVDLNGNDTKGIAFIMRNGTNTYPVINYAVSIDSVETLTGINFFPQLDDSLENRLESSYDISQWFSEKEAGSVKVTEPEEMPEGAINTIQAKGYIGQKKTVCGTVVSTRVWKDNKAIFMNLDQKFPNHVFSATIWGNNIVNFPYEPATTLMNRKVCITGTIGKYKEVPSMELKNDESILFIDEIEE
ncbi:MAG: DNA/RNA non-specific endonuclease [Bacteroidetes bacterium HGW-Bacteroidetes-21]|nr:MAG: DNA/RNA non-specific endonuclease [Bacteroidetes bacterium HGW-Bacteroidetes-21]